MYLTLTVSVVMIASDLRPVFRRANIKYWHCLSEMPQGRCAAAYELHELEESFERVSRHSPQWRKKPIAEMMTSITKDPMAALEQAIKSADAARFTAAYGQLTEACNTCHQSAEVGMIVIQVPDASTFPDQDFRPAKR